LSDEVDEDEDVSDKYEAVEVKSPAVEASKSNGSRKRAGKEEKDSGYF
jgi:hypothetical protein